MIDYRATRRQLLLGIAAVALFSGCTTKQTPQASPVSKLMASKPFYIAHRGSGDNWTEHTLEAYDSALSNGVSAIEISVRATADDVLVCHHDPNTKRLTGTALSIAKSTFAEISELRNNAQEWLGPKAPLLPIPKLKDVLDKHAGKSLLFIEDKTGGRVKEIVDLMLSYPDAKEHFVWKAPVTSKSYTIARDAGFTTWGFLPEEVYDHIGQYAAKFDLLGIYYGASDTLIKQVISYGKPVICWEVHNRSTRDRLRRLGVNIMMCSNVLYVANDQARATKDDFASGLRAAGDLPWNASAGWEDQPKILPEISAVRLSAGGNPSYIMGSMCPIKDPEKFTLNYSFRWPTRLPSSGAHAGVAFGQESDDDYRVHFTSQVSGYHLIVRPNGKIELFLRPAGQKGGNKIGEVAGPALTAGEWVKMQAIVSPSEISVVRVGTQAKFTARDSKFRGAYFSLTKNYENSPPVEFKEVQIS